MSGSPAAALPPLRPWHGGPGEVHPEVKQRATSMLEALGTWAQGHGDLASARRRLAAVGVDPSLAAQARVLLGGDAAAVLHVVNAQYGGILPSAASVLIVVTQVRRTAAGSVRTTGTTLDVRLSAARPRWRVTAVHPAQPLPPARHLSATARAVLADRRIHLPAAARADVAAGSVSDSVLHALRGLAASWVVDVSVLRSGHPLDVFGTNRPSDHLRGHAADVWALDGHRIVDPANRALARTAMRRAAALGAYQVGGPEDLDGAGRQYFSDATHQDHIHLGFHH